MCCKVGDHLQPYLGATVMLCIYIYSFAPALPHQCMLLSAGTLSNASICCTGIVSRPQPVKHPMPLYMLLLFFLM